MVHFRTPQSEAGTFAVPRGQPKEKKKGYGTRNRIKPEIFNSTNKVPALRTLCNLTLAYSENKP